MVSFVFSKLAYKAGLSTARFPCHFRNAMKCMAALSSFFIALGFKLTYINYYVFNIDATYKVVSIVATTYTL